MFDNILIVCTGNICRSPVTEALFRLALPNRRIESAGIQALTGQAADPIAVELAALEGLDLSGHRARQLNMEMLQLADIVLVMTENQRLAIGEMHPAASGKIMLLGQWLQNPDSGKNGMEIPDPHTKSRNAFVLVHKLLKESVASWHKRLSD